MSVRIVNVETNDRQGTITVEADGQEEVMGPDARAEALKAAASNGLQRPGISGSPSAYPVDAEGNTSDDLIMGRGRVAAYRCDFPVTAGL